MFCGGCGLPNLGLKLKATILELLFSWRLLFVVLVKDMLLKLFSFFVAKAALNIGPVALLTAFDVAA